MPITSQRAAFRYDINTLRAIAVAGVVLFHFKVPYFEGGFVGVDIFFVISGYLMTRIVLNGIFKQNFSVPEFYVKRGQRILPALIFMIALLTVFNFFKSLPLDFHDFLKNSIGSILFFSNIIYATRNYFDVSSESNILLHTWSLSVEWQFYLILPLILLFFNIFFKNNRKKFLLLFIILTALIFACSVMYSFHNPQYSFYMLQSRCWEMMVGGIAFLAEDRIVFRFKKILAISCYLILGLCLITLNNQMTWPGGFTLIPVMATFLILICNQNTFSLLKNNVLQVTGKISYSLYLYHWPVFVITNYFGIECSLITVTGMLIVSVVLALCSYTYIENFKYNQTRTIISVAVVLLAVSGGLFIKDINRMNFKPRTLLIAAYKTDHYPQIMKQYGTQCCLLELGKGPKAFNTKECLTIQKDQRNILLVGDSHAAQYSQSLREFFSKQHINLLHASVTNSLPLIHKMKQPLVNDAMDVLFTQYIPEHAKDIDGVILCANWVSSHEQGLLVKDLMKTVDYLRKMGIPALIIGQNETYKIPYTSVAAREYEFDKHFSNSFLEPQTAELNDMLKAGLAGYYLNVYHLNISDKMSDSFEPYLIDEDHLSKYGADWTIRKISSDRVFTNFLSGKTKALALRNN